jgi:C4-dicarboxylate-binding protein DctP
MPRLLLALPLLLLSLLLVPAGPATGTEPIVIRFAHVVAENTPKGIAANLFRQRAEAAFPGRVKVEVYPESRRYTDEEVLLALILGDVELAAPSFTLFERFAPAVQVFELPFLFQDIAHVHRFQATPTGQALLASMRDRGLKGLAYWDSGMRVIGADRPLPLPDDARGLTFRIENSAIFQAQYARIGVIAIQMPFRQIKHALKRGLINGIENSWSNIYSFGMYPILRDYTETDHSFLGYMLVTSHAFWDKLPPDVRAGLEAIIAEVSAEERRIAAEKAIGDRALVAAGDARILRPDPAQREAWRAAFMPVWRAYADEIGQDVIDAAMEAATPR